ncbi:PQQ-dependent sugar dehydrogenase [Myxococcota bacterium]|nr:PQQ-dependent sugar dehydrogenase [Myxococcota bacterium]
MDRRTWSKIVVAALVTAIGATVFACTGIRHGLVGMFSPSYEGPAKPADARVLAPAFEEPDGRRPRIDVALVEVARGFVQITDLQFVPSDSSLLVVLEKAGTARWVDLDTGKRGVSFTVAVRDDSEQGLLGLAFHPKFSENGRIFLNYVTRSDGADVTRIAEWTVPPGADLREIAPTPRRTILDVPQPYQNHNAGQLTFGPDGLLYVGLGDGGWRDDPHGHGQDTTTLLGDMLRIDVDASDPGREYRVPPDNPFVGRAGFRPEIWAYGLRNPWRYSFDPAGRLVVADVGQDAYEEVSIVEKGANLGWKIREAAHCFEPKEGCRTDGIVDPVFEYGRDEGGSITGGYVALGARAPALRGRYVAGDFLSGRLWALELPETASGRAKVHALGKFPLLPSTFGRDAAGDLYVADYPEGIVYRLEAPARVGG